MVKIALNEKRITLRPALRHPVLASLYCSRWAKSVPIWWSFVPRPWFQIPSRLPKPENCQHWGLTVGRTHHVYEVVKSEQGAHDLFVVAHDYVNSRTNALVYQLKRHQLRSHFSKIYLKIWKLSSIFCSIFSIHKCVSGVVNCRWLLDR